jgi:diguanylate cyclase (GGDEF)-like protein
MNRDLRIRPTDVLAYDSTQAACHAVLEENDALRRQVQRMVGEAQRNERSLRRFQSLELDLLGSESLASMLMLLTLDAPRRCEWDRVSLFLHDAEYEVRRLLHQDHWEPVDSTDLVFLDTPERLEILHQRGRGPRLGPYQSSLHGDLFGASGAPVTSIALLPVIRHGRLFGSYNLGSYRADRFPHDAGRDFLHHLAAVIAVCLEIAITRDRLQHLGLADALTGANNRRYFEQRLPEEVARAQRSGSPLSCLFIDIDHFKRLNDTYGHRVGDQALRGVGKLMRASLRRGDVLARYGGEEFSVLLPQTSEDAAALVSERLRNEVASARFAGGGGRSVSITVSIGVATLNPPVVHSEPNSLGALLVEAADRGLYRAKAGGRNRVILQPMLN